MKTKLLILVFLLLASVAYAGMTFNGMIWNKQAAGVDEYLLMEDSSYLLLEDGTSKIILE